MIRKVLITGASGFIGRHLSSKFAELGLDVACLVHSNMQLCSQFDNLKLYQVDLRDVERMTAVLGSFKPDAVIHLAAIASPVHGVVSEIYDVNVRGSECLFDAALSSGMEGTKFILASTAGVYGNSCQEFISEDAAYRPVNHYALSKVSMELLSKCYEDIFDIKIIRPFNVIGIGQNKKFLVPKLIQAFHRRENVIRVGNIETVRDYVDVDYATQAVMNLTFNDKFTGKVLNICSGVGTSGLELIELLRNITGFNPVIEVSSNFVRSKEISRLVGNPMNLQNLVGESTKKLSVKEILENMIFQCDNQLL